MKAAEEGEECKPRRNGSDREAGGERQRERQMSIMQHTKWQARL